VSVGGLFSREMGRKERREKKERTFIVELFKVVDLVFVLVVAVVAGAQLEIPHTSVRRPSGLCQNGSSSLRRYPFAAFPAI